ncbi:MAG: PAS domain-containing protein [Halobacteriales archaeon]
MDERVRVLHVEDDAEFADLAADLLERQDDCFDVTSVTDPEEALSRVSTGEFDCVVSDYDMMGMNGIEFLEAVRERRPDLPFVLFTGKGSEEIASEAISAGVTDYLQKASGSSQYEVLANRVENAVEQHRARRAVDETQRKLEELAEKTDDVLYMFDADWNELLFGNSVYEEMWGGSLDEVEEDARAFLDRVHPDDRDSVRRTMERVSDGEEETVEYRVVRPDGDVRWVVADSKPVFEDGEVARIVGYVRDVTEQKLRRRRYEAIFNHTYQFTGLTEPDGTVIEANDTALEFGGLDRDDVVGEKIWEADWFEISEEARNVARRSVRRAAEGELVKGEMEVQGDGRNAVIDYSVRPVTDEDGDVVLLVLEGRDITERVEREREIQRRQDELETKTRYLDAISRYTPLPMFMKDASAEYIWVNDEYLEIFELDEEDVLGRTDGDIHPGYVAEQFEANDREVLESGVMLEVEEEVETADGTRTYLSSKAPVYFDGEEGRADAVFGAAVDVTGMKRRERDLEQMNQRLEEFASVVSHDLRNPLGVAKGRLELAREDPDGGHLNQVERSLDRMERIIEDVLWLTREGRSIGDKRDVDLPALAREAWRNVEAAIASLEVELEGGTEVLADDDRLLQVFENLYANAVEHAGEGVTVVVGGLDDGFYVEDDGPGVPEDRRERVFEPGYSTADDGTGFGLSIVRRVAEAHGWDVVLSEAPSGGARFEFRGVEFVRPERQDNG